MVFPALSTCCFVRGKFTARDSTAHQLLHDFSHLNAGVRNNSPRNKKETVRVRFRNRSAVLTSLVVAGADADIAGRWKTFQGCHGLMRALCACGSYTCRKLLPLTQRSHTLPILSYSLIRGEEEHDRPCGLVHCHSARPARWTTRSYGLAQLTTRRLLLVVLLRCCFAAVEL